MIGLSGSTREVIIEVAAIVTTFDMDELDTYETVVQQPQSYLVIGFTPDGRPDTDLFLSHAIDAGSSAATVSKPVTGGIQLVD